MSEPRTFEEWRETTSGWTEHELELAELAWNDSRAALLADRPDVAGLVGLLQIQAALPQDPRHREVTVRAISALESPAAQLAAREEEVKRLRESDVRYRGFVEWFDLYGVSINTVADPRGSYLLNWHRGEVFGNTMNELIDAVDTSIAATKEPTR